jgi:thioredoxin-dependent peroxiredoxin
MIDIGTAAPDFEAEDSRGAQFRLSTLRGKPVVLYFFPKAFTTGCTSETQRFAALAPELASKGVEIVGVSVDSAETQHRFAEHCHAGFLLLSDSTKAIARAYGVLSLLGIAKRVTFYIDEEGVVRDVVAGMLPGPHLERTRARFLSSP